MADTGPIIEKRSAFTLYQSQTKAVPRKSGAQLKVDAFNKYGIPVSNALAASASKAAKKAKAQSRSIPSTGSVTTWDGMYEVEYVSAITIGKDVYHVILDTGSSDL